MRKLCVLAFIVQAAACAHPVVSLHATESDKNHYVIIEDGAVNRYWDCHGLDAGQWTPTCRQVRMQSYYDGAWAENSRPVRSRE
jgi:hypothetical protein